MLTVDDDGDDDDGDDDDDENNITTQSKHPTELTEPGHFDTAVMPARFRSTDSNDRGLNFLCYHSILFIWPY